MILTQRKRHLYLWGVFAMILPVLFVLAILVIPQEKIESPQASSPEKITINYSHTPQGSLLEVNILQPLSVPGCLVLLSDDKTRNPETAVTVGEVSGMGSYQFQLPTLESTPGYVLIFNPFNQVVTHQFPI